MNENTTFAVHVERATPACSENCPNLQILDEHEKSWSDMQATVISTYRCVNDTYCMKLWESMKAVIKEKNDDK